MNENDVEYANEGWFDADQPLTLDEVTTLMIEKDGFTEDEQQTFRAALAELLDQVQLLGMSRRLFLFEVHEALEPESELGNGGIFGDDDELSTSSVVFPR
jgi:hypothetical protein